jgi:hypothetical protein
MSFVTNEDGAVVVYAAKQGGSPSDVEIRDALQKSKYSSVFNSFSARKFTVEQLFAKAETLADCTHPQLPWAAQLADAFAAIARDDGLSPIGQSVTQKMLYATPHAGSLQPDGIYLSAVDLWENERISVSANEEGFTAEFHDDGITATYRAGADDRPRSKKPMADSALSADTPWKSAGIPIAEPEAIALLTVLNWKDPDDVPIGRIYELLQKQGTPDANTQLLKRKIADALVEAL